MLYCIEVERELEDKCVLHYDFDKEPTREEVLEVVYEAGLDYEDDYGKLNYYQHINLLDQIDFFREIATRFPFLIIYRAIIFS